MKADPFTIFAIFIVSFALCGPALGEADPGSHASVHAVTLTRDDAHKRLDIAIDGQPFTSLLWSPELRKPVLYPLIAPDGTTLTRNNPPLPGERTDHPHHIGLWFNYSNVNGFDFWNNSDAIPPAKRADMGNILLTKLHIDSTGSNRAAFTTTSSWTSGFGQDLILQTSHYTITVLPNGDRQLDLVFILNAPYLPVTFKDDKDGMLGIRVAQFLESPTEKSGTYADSNGIVTKVNGPASPLATGVYLTSEGKQGDAAWGTRGTWCTLTGTSNGNAETIAIFDHPLNPGYPTYWHARGYGLFAVNPLGVTGFDPKAAPMNFTMKKGETATFRYRVLLLSHSTTPAAMDAAEKSFAAQYR